MSIPAAYFGVVLIWSTTPLAIQWSGRDVGPLFGLSARMLIGVVVLGVILAALRRPLPSHRQAWQSYLAGGLGLYAAMVCVYFAAQHLPSGWISVIFGTTPIITGLFAALWLGERAFTPPKILGIALGIGGLGVIFHDSTRVPAAATFAVALVALSVVFHSLSAVWVKRLGAGLDGISATMGSLFVATPLFVLTWLIADGHWPARIPLQTGLAIGYLGLFGSALGFSLYFFLLRRLSASQLAMITLLTPVLALWIGQGINHEPVTAATYFGTVIILSGLLVHQFGARMWDKLKSRQPRSTRAS
ncbi:MAG: DMT family transporter [Thiotrichales bacterium]